MRCATCGGRIAKKERDAGCYDQCIRCNAPMHFFYFSRMYEPVYGDKDAPHRCTGDAGKDPIGEPLCTQCFKEVGVNE